MNTAQESVSHARCGAKTRAGTPCQRRPIPGGTRCNLHGGKIPRVQRAAKRRLAEAEAAKAVAKWGGRTDIAPAAALLELVQRKAAEVAFWDAKVTALSADELAGLNATQVQQGRGPQGPVDVTTATVQPHIYLELFHKAQDQLAAYSAAAIRAGAEEQFITTVKAQAGELVSFCREVLAAAGVPRDAAEQALALVVDQRRAALGSTVS